jgi:sarcosine oxidase
VDEGRFYGFPVHGVPGFKIGKYHHLEETGDADWVDREPHPYDEEVLRECTQRYFPDAAGPTMTLATCMFTNSPDKHFIIDLHPDYPQVAFASAFSGHGYKFASVIGETMADLAERGSSRHNIELFRLERFAGEPQGFHGAGRPGTVHGQRAGYGARLEHRASQRSSGSGGSAIADEAPDAIRTFW